MRHFAAGSLRRLLLVATAFAIGASVVGVSRVAAHIGGDISEPYDKSVFECCRKRGWEFVVVRSYQSFGAPDPHAPESLRNAHAAGIPTRDVYHFPCVSVDAKKQVDDDHAHVKGLFGTMWFDIETNNSPGCGWHSDKKANCHFMGELAEAAKAAGISSGIYASEYMWSSIMGDDCHVGKEKGQPLWYAHYDGQPNFKDFTPFGGWEHPAAKQYGDSVGYCGINSDADFKP